MNSKWIKALKIKPKTIELLEGNIRGKLLDFDLGKALLGLKPKAQATKRIINKWEYIRLKSFCTAKKAINKIERQPTEQGKIFAN